MSMVQNPPAGTPPIPTVFSISYGGPTEFYPSYLQECEAGLAQLVAMGMTIVVSSGDSGASGSKNSTTTTVLNPSYPASSSWVVAVGATQLTTQTNPACNQGSATFTVGFTTGAQCFGERSASTATNSVITSGGGFSSVFPQPTWQAAVVNAYTALVSLQPVGVSGYFPLNRGFPDVAALVRGSNIRCPN